MEVSRPSFRDRIPVQAYGEGGFRFGGLRVEGSVLLLTGGMEPWPVSSMAELTLESLKPVLAEAERIDFLLLGCGPKIAHVPGEIQKGFLDAGLGIEHMDTGAACRAYNVLIAEDRRLAAAFIAIG